jgi:hypothetical protein
MRRTRVAQAEGPLIYVSYGMRKSGSTLAFELTKAILEQNGFPQPRLSRQAVPSDAGINFVHQLSQAQLEAIEAEARALGSPMVLKTHVAPTPEAAAWVAAGRIRGHCVYRDPREMALSTLDHGRRARERGEQAFANIETLEDAIADIHHQVPNFLEWVRLPGFLPLFYDDVAFDTRSTVRRLCRQLGLKADPDEVERIAKQERFTQYNKGVPGRAKELPPEDGERILEAFRDFYEEFIPDRAGPPPAAPAPSEPPRAGALKPTDRIWNLLRLRR